MPDARFDDLPILGELGASLRAGMERAESESHPEPETRGRRRRARFGWLGSVMVLGLVGTAAAAGTLTLLRGSPIPGPNTADTQPSMTPKRDSLRVVPLRAADPSGAGLPFTLRVGESEAGQTCATVGQVDDGDFGIVGEDGRFRELPPAIVDACGDETDHDAAVVGARVLEARRYRDSRTVVYGVGERVDSVVLIDRGRRVPLEVRDGAFVAALTGYPEDHALSVRMQIDGRTVTRNFGRGPFLILDPSGPAWTFEQMGWARGEQQYGCVALKAARRRTPTSPVASTPSLCTAQFSPSRRQVPRPREPWFFAIRTLRAGERGRSIPGDRFSGWAWRAASRTVIWGRVDERKVRRIVIEHGHHAERVPVRIGGAFGLVLPATVPAHSVRVHLTLRSGTTRTFTRSVLPNMPPAGGPR
jgi:hypothetical protein